ncbi:hypothetical protein AB6A40_001238 [Gnathostoma spinigerum]|uniref:protein-tyrosine-phosphatase n=1 Tax=Gnathostoma spinigerum TaxID=75299 RepID=A0ABD6E8P6_9BILA
MAREFLISKYREHESNHSWNALFQNIQNLSDKQERSLKLSTRVAHSSQNVDKNRYRNVSTYDCSRVRLQRTEDDQSDYINASPLCLPLARRNYILTQGPLSSTCNDFWQMIWEQECTLIVMLNKVIERNSPKCHQYFPVDSNSECVFATFTVRLLSTNSFPHFIVRTLQLIATDDRMLDDDTEPARTLLHYQFISWPDFGVPHSSNVFIEFLEHVKATKRLEQPPPAVIHCSAGIGRTGAFVVVDSVLSMIEEKVSNVDVEQLVVKMRRYRMGLIQTPQQLQFCWKTIVDALLAREQTEKMPKTLETEECAPISNNVLVSGKPNGPHLNRSAGNQMTTGEKTKSLVDIPSFRKRSKEDGLGNEDDIKYARRRQRIEEMRIRLRESERCHNRRSSFFLKSSPQTVVAVAFAVAAVVVVGTYLYRMTSSA